MKSDEQHADEVAAYRESIGRRARKVIAVVEHPKFLEQPEAWRFVLAQYGLGLMIALTQLCGAQLRDAWLRWVGGLTREWTGCCSFCGRLKTTPGADMCTTCEQDCQTMDQELALDELAAMPAKSDLR